MDKKVSYELKTERLGPLPLVNHFIDRLGLTDIMAGFIPSEDSRCRLPSVRGLGVLLRSIITEREPIYRLGEVVNTFAPEGFGLDETAASSVTDDAIGRALDRLFDADRGCLLTEIVLKAGERFKLAFDELHNDSSTVKFTGQYRQATGRSIRCKKAPFITYGYSKDHRPDLKQLLFVLTTTRDGDVPVQFRCEAGNESDSRTHEETWEALCQVTGRRDFLYVGDSKLCNLEAMDYIDRKGGRFVTVMPRNRLEDREFREWIQTHDPAWEKAIDRKNPYQRGGPRDRWYVHRHHLPSQECWPVTWVYSILLRLKQEQSRRDRIARAEQELQDLADRLQGPRPRKRARHEILKKIDEILKHRRVKRYLHVSLKSVAEHSFRQERRGRPGPNTRYVKKTKRRWSITWRLDEEAIAYDHRSDGMYPLLTNDKSLSALQVLEAHKRQPTVEKRFKQIKSVMEIAPVFLNNEGRIEAMFFLYFVALLVQALIERELRLSMIREKVEALPLYPEERCTHRPTAEQVLKLFSLVERHRLYIDEQEVNVFEPKLTDLQEQILRLLDVPETAYRS